MASSTPKNVILTGTPPIKEALVASAVVTPGMLLLRTSATQFRPHNVAAGMAQAYFAVERDWTGGDITTNYAVGDTISYAACDGGDAVYALVAANAGAIVAGDFLESDGAGGLRKSTHAITTATTAAAWPVAVALEALDNSANAFAARIRAEIL